MNYYLEMKNIEGGNYHGDGVSWFNKFQVGWDSPPIPRPVPP
jgi:hypothetical protein